MDDQSLAITHVRERRGELEAIHDTSAELGIALDAERENSAELAFAKELLGAVIVGVRSETGVRHPVYGGVLLEVLGEGEGVLAVTLDTEGEGLDALEKKEGRVSGEAAPEILSRSTEKSAKASAMAIKRQSKLTLRTSTRTLMAKARFPNVSEKRSPW